MPWWGWVSVGIVLIGAELVAVDAAFYLIFVGAAALLVGIIGLVGFPLPEWGQLLAFAVFAVASLALFRVKLYGKISGHPGFEYTVTGRVVSVDEEVPRGQPTRVSLQGTQWPAVNVGPGSIPAGSRARVVGRDGMNLSIEELVDDTVNKSKE